MKIYKTSMMTSNIDFNLSYLSRILAIKRLHILLLTLLILLIGFSPSFAFQPELIHKAGDYYYYKTPVSEPLPANLRAIIEKEYYSAFDPSLHKHLSNKDLAVDPRFSTYQTFLADLIKNDFRNYGKNPSQGTILFFACKDACTPDFSNVAGVAFVLPQNKPGNYYIDHFGVFNGHKLKKVGTTLLHLLEVHLPWSKISLDTRVFNTPAITAYDKSGYIALQKHPKSKKQGLYIHYTKEIKQENAEV